MGIAQGIDLDGLAVAVNEIHVHLEVLTHPPVRRGVADVRPDHLHVDIIPARHPREISDLAELKAVAGELQQLPEPPLYRRRDDPVLAQAEREYEAAANTLLGMTAVPGRKDFLS